MPNEPRPLLTGTLTAQYVNPVKPGKKMGSFKDANGELWFAYPSDLTRVTQGDSIAVEYTEAEGERGLSRFITKLTAINGNQPAPPPPPTQTPPPEASQQQDERNPPPSNQPPKPAATPATGAELQAESIFVTGIVGRTMQSGQFSSTDIALLTKAAMEAWRDRHNIVPASGS